MNLDIPAVWLLPFLMLLARVGGLMIFVPFLSSTAIAPSIRVALSIGLSVLLFPLVQNEIPAAPESMPHVILFLAGELMIGLLFGFVGNLLMEGLQLAGHIIGFQMGLGIINVIDPQTQVETPVVSILQNVIGLLVFLSLNAHHWFIEAIVESYRVAPHLIVPGNPLFQHLVESASQVFVLAVKVSAPVLVVLFIVDLIMGIVGRAAPQIHVLVVGMPAKSLAGMMVLLLTVPSGVVFLFQEFRKLEGEINRLLTLLAN